MRTILSIAAVLLVGCRAGRPPDHADAGPADALPVDAARDAAVRGVIEGAYIKASNADAFDRFGDSVALSSDGSTLAVGAYHEDSAAIGINGDQADNSLLDAGAVYVFTRSGTTWTQQAYLKASNADRGDVFGYSVALSADGSILAVGAPFEDSAAIGIDGDQADDTANGAGAVYVFTRSGTTWSQQAYIKASNTETRDVFGGDLALSGDGSTLAVAAHAEDSAATGIDGIQSDNSVENSGAVYVYTRSGATWTQQAYVKASNTERFDNLGTAVALSADGSTLAVGAEGEASAATGIDGDQADNTAGASGAVYMYTRSGVTWTQQGYIKASNTEQVDHFGTSVALSADGSTLAVDARDEDSAATGIDGDQADNSAPDAGAVYVYTRSGTTWSQQAYVKASNTEASDRFGHGLALSADGATLVVGAWDEASAATGLEGDQTDNSAPGAGAAYWFERSGTTWSQRVYVKASNTDRADHLSVPAVSYDGSILVLAAWNEASAAIGIDGNQADNSAPGAGAVYVYAREAP